MNANGPKQEQGARQEQGRSDAGWHSWQEKLDEIAQTCTEKLIEIEGRLRSEVGDVVTPEARVHFQNSKREFLTGLREIIDRHLQNEPSAKHPGSGSEKPGR